jgi:hypothetical protein
MGIKNDIQLLKRLFVISLVAGSEVDSRPRGREASALFLRVSQSWSNADVNLLIDARVSIRYYLLVFIHPLLNVCLL